MEDRVMSQQDLAQSVRASGLSITDIVNRTGISGGTLQDLLNKNCERDSGKMMSRETLLRLADVLGLQYSMGGLKGLRKGRVNVWRYPSGYRGDLKSWQSACKSLRDTYIDSSEPLMGVVLKAKQGLLRKSEFIVMLWERQRDLKLAIVGLNRKGLKFVENELLHSVHTTQDIVFEEMQKLNEQLDRDVLKASVFRAYYGTQYSWQDVQVAAREFDFDPDQIIDLMVNERKPKAVDDGEQAELVEIVDPDSWSIRTLGQRQDTQPQLKVVGIS